MLCVDNWQREEYNYERLDHGKWELTIPPNEDGSCRIPHNTVMKVCHVMSEFGVLTNHGTLGSRSTHSVLLGTVARMDV